MLNRIRNAFRSLFRRNPSITIKVVGETWNCQWKHMTPEDAEWITRVVADTIASREFAQLPCSVTVH